MCVCMRERERGRELYCYIDRQTIKLDYNSKHLLALPSSLHEELLRSDQDRNTRKASGCMFKTAISLIDSRITNSELSILASKSSLPNGWKKLGNPKGFKSMTIQLGWGTLHRHGTEHAKGSLERMKKH